MSKHHFTLSGFIASLFIFFYNDGNPSGFMAVFFHLRYKRNIAVSKYNNYDICVKTSFYSFRVDHLPWFAFSYNGDKPSGFMEGVFPLPNKYVIVLHINIRYNLSGFLTPSFSIIVSSLKKIKKF